MDKSRPNRQFKVGRVLDNAKACGVFLLYTRNIAFYPLFRMKSRISDSMVTRMKALGIREPVKGSLHVIVQRGFVDYVLHNETSWALRGILKTARMALYQFLLQK